jgi:hypothetical protein
MEAQISYSKPMGAERTPSWHQASDLLYLYTDIPFIANGSTADCLLAVKRKAAIGQKLYSMSFIMSPDWFKSN